MESAKGFSTTMFWINKNDVETFFVGGEHTSISSKIYTYIIYIIIYTCINIVIILILQCFKVFKFIIEQFSYFASSANLKQIENAVFVIIIVINDPSCNINN